MYYRRQLNALCVSLVVVYIWSLDRWVFYFVAAAAAALHNTVGRCGVDASVEHRDGINPLKNFIKGSMLLLPVVPHRRCVLLEKTNTGRNEKG